MTQLTKAMIRSELPAPVVQRVLALQERYRTRKASLEIKVAGETLWGLAGLMEGA